MTQKQLSIELNNWFKSNKPDKNFWNANPVALIIKENLIKMGNFKGRKRGNPKRAYKKMLFKLAQNNGYEGEFEG